MHRPGHIYGPCGIGNSILWGCYQPYPVTALETQAVRTWPEEPGVTSAIAHHGSDPMGEQNDGFASRSKNFRHRISNFGSYLPSPEWYHNIHEGGSLMRETLSVNAHKYVETT